MKPFFVLLGTFCIVLLLELLLNGEVSFVSAGNISLSVMLLFTALGHFKFTKGMTMMLPSFIPAKRFVIFLTGFLEIAAAVCLHIPTLSYYTGWLLMAMFVLFLPANVYAAGRHLNYETASYDGKGWSYLWFRVPFQLLLMGWIWWFVLRQ